MTGVQTCALPISFSTFINGSTSSDGNCHLVSDWGHGSSCAVNFQGTYAHTYSLEVRNAIPKTRRGLGLDVCGAEWFRDNSSLSLAYVASCCIRRCFLGLALVQVTITLSLRGEVGHPLSGLASLEYPFVAYFRQNEAMIRYSMTLPVVHRVQKYYLPVVAYTETNLTYLSSESWLLTTAVCWICLLGMTKPGAAKKAAVGLAIDSSSAFWASGWL